MWYDNIKFNHKTCLNKYNETNDIEENIISLYVVVTRKCNVNCKFCEFAKGKCELDIKVFEKLYRELQNKCTVSMVHFTGGEPTLELNKIKEICDIVKDCDKFTTTSINTNGTNLDKLKGIKNLDNIALSRHHYLDCKNQEIFGSILVPNAEKINNFSEKYKIHISCNLIKGYIDNEIEIKNYLDFVGSLGIIDVGLVSLMNINDFCMNNYVDFDNLDLSKITNLCNSRYFRKYDKNNNLLCRCDNYLYTTDNLSLLSMYHRHAIKNNCISDYLVFEDNHIKQGFSGNCLI